ncbi:MAG: type II toxin-antitoxin system Phd/YefM family antitoxin [Anaerolineae bacterium]|nr:type II toxin-antitoxin system Phd/YefM family antitoxin [Anaerolineae bacterium]
MAKWQLQEAKKNLSQLIDQALADGPQIITRHGIEAVVVMTVAHYRKRATDAKPGGLPNPFPLRNSGLVIERAPTLMDAYALSVTSV